MALFCSNCGNQLPDDSRFCLRCGTPVAGAAPTSGTPSSVPYQNTAYATPSAPQYPRPGEYAQYPQPPQGVPFAPNVPAAQKQKKNRWPLVIVAAIVVVVIVASSVLYINYANQSTPDKTLTSFCNDLQSGDYSSAYTLLSSRIQKLSTQTQWDAGLALAFKAKGGISTCSTGNVSASGSKATGNMTLNYGNRTNETDRVSMIQENGSWKVDDLSRLSSSTP